MEQPKTWDEDIMIESGAWRLTAGDTKFTLTHSGSAEVLRGITAVRPTSCNSPARSAITSIVEAIEMRVIKPDAALVALLRIAASMDVWRALHHAGADHEACEIGMASPPASASYANSPEGIRIERDQYRSALEEIIQICAGATVRARMAMSTARVALNLWRKARGEEIATESDVNAGAADDAT
jgi:hypothetical protein